MPSYNRWDAKGRPLGRASGEAAWMWVMAREPSPSAPGAISEDGGFSACSWASPTFPGFQRALVRRLWWLDDVLGAGDVDRGKPLASGDGHNVDAVMGAILLLVGVI